MNTNKLVQMKELFLTFFKIGAFTFGGGYAMIPLIQREAAERKKWISDDDILEIVAIAESTPGPIAINAATFIGYRAASLPGAFAATFGVVLPSFLIILLVFRVLEMAQGIRAVQYAFAGIRAGVLALLIRALWTMFRKCPKSLPSCLIMAAAFLLTAFFHVPVMPVIIGCALFGLAAAILAEKGGGKTG